MADPQDLIVAQFTEYVTTDAQALVADILAFHRPLADILFSCASLDDAHKTQIREVNKAALRLLRSRLDSLAPTIALAQQAGDV